MKVRGRAPTIAGRFLRKKTGQGKSVHTICRCRAIRWEPLAKAAPAKRRKGAAETVPFPDPLTGDAIRAWRSSLGETQAAFAARIGVTAASISQWEKKGLGLIGVQPRTLVALSKAWKRTH